MTARSLLGSSPTMVALRRRPSFNVNIEFVRAMRRHGYSVKISPSGVKIKPEPLPRNARGSGRGGSRAWCPWSTSMNVTARADTFGGCDDGLGVGVEEFAVVAAKSADPVPNWCRWLDSR